MRQLAPDHKAQSSSPDQLSIVEWRNDPDRRVAQRLGQQQLTHAADQPGQDQHSQGQWIRRHPVERRTCQTQHHTAQREVENDRRPPLGVGDLTDGDHGACCSERAQNAQRHARHIQVARYRVRHDQNADESHHDRRPAVPANRLAEQQC